MDSYARSNLKHFDLKRRRLRRKQNTPLAYKLDISILARQRIVSEDQDGNLKDVET